MNSLVKLRSTRSTVWSNPRSTLFSPLKFQHKLIPALAIIRPFRKIPLHYTIPSQRNSFIGSRSTRYLSVFVTISGFSTSSADRSSQVTANPLLISDKVPFINPNKEKLALLNISNMFCLSLSPIRILN